ncbi:hypothetical protein KCU95_g7113, partial [Aureobasidium melanogenum]
MKTAEELMPGGRWLSVPGNNYESAFYALTVGMSTSSNTRRQLDWSQSAHEGSLHAFLIKLWVAETGEHPSDHPVGETFLSTMFPALISVVNSSKRLRDYNVYQEKNGTLESLNGTSASPRPTKIFLRQINNRWECFGYYRQDQDLKITSERRVASSPSAAPFLSKTLNDLAAPARHVSTSVSSGGQAYNTFSNLVQVDIKPIVDTSKPTDARNLKLCLNVNSWQNETIESTAKQNGTEDAEQRKRKEAEAAAAAYAAQDRCDSCSDSE